MITMIPVHIEIHWEGPVFVGEGLLLNIARVGEITEDIHTNKEYRIVGNINIGYSALEINKRRREE